MNFVDMSTDDLRQFIAQAAGVLAHRDGGASVDSMLRRLGDRLAHRPRRFDGPKSARVILETVSAETGITMGELLGQDKTARVVSARHEAWRRLYSVVEKNGHDRVVRKYSCLRIAGWFNVHHSTVLNALGATAKSRARAVAQAAKSAA